MVLEVETNTRKIYKRLDARLAELLWVTDTRSLEDQWRAEGAARYNDLLAGSDNLRCQLAGSKRLGWDGLDPNGLVALDDNLKDSKYHIKMASVFAYLLHFGVDHQMQVLVHGSRGVNVAMRGIGAASSVSVDPFEPVLGAVSGHEILQVIGRWNALRLGCPQEIIFDRVGVIAERHLDWSFESVDVTIVA